MPGFDRTGPQGQGSMTGGRRGICTGAVRGGNVPQAGYGLGRGGRPYGGGRGFGWGGGYGNRAAYYGGEPRVEVLDGPDATAEQASVANAINGILDRLTELGEIVTGLYDRIEGSRKSRNEEEEK